MVRSESGAAVLTPNVGIPFLPPVRYVTYTNSYNSSALRSLPRVVGTESFDSLPCAHFIENSGYSETYFLPLWAFSVLKSFKKPVAHVGGRTSRL